MRLPRSRSVAGALLCILALPYSDYAAATTVTFSGEVTEVIESGASAPSGVTVGDTVTGLLRYDANPPPPDTAPGDSTIGVYSYTTQDAEFSLTIGALTWATDGSLADSLSVIVYDGFAGVHRYAGDAMGDQPGDFSVFPGQLPTSDSRLFFALQDIAPPLGLVASDALPDDPSDLQLGNVTPGQAVGFIRSQEIILSNSWQINFDIDVETFNIEVPEPRSLLLLCSSLGVLAGWARRRSQAAL